MSAAALKRELARVLRELGVEHPNEVELERPRNPEHGDWATNAAMTLAKPLGLGPRRLAEKIVESLDRDGAGVASAEVAGPGFINFRLSPQRFLAGLADVVAQDKAYGRSDAGRGKPVNVEFVSANPTGPLHIGHGRQAALGDAVAGLLAWTGWKVHREYYYNDAGAQVERLAHSVWVRYQQHFGREAELPADAYRGEYVAELAARLAAKRGDRLVDDKSAAALDEVRRFAVAGLMEEIERDLDQFGVRFDSYFRESSLYDGGRVGGTVERLRHAGVTYQQEGALWLRATDFGDDKDRVMVRGDGRPTYFLPDVAYHLTKWERGFHQAINVQGADHHGTVARVRAGLRALGLPRGYPEYLLHQMVLVTRGGEEVKFSKRAGGYVTLRELYHEVGVDVARYFFLMRRPEAQLTFDLDLALDRSDKNPVYKVQYAHARMCSIFRKAGVDEGQINAAAVNLSLLGTGTELEVIKVLLAFPEVVAEAASQRAPHTVCAYLERLASEVNSWYHAGNLDPSLRVVGVGEELQRARLVLARGIRVVIRNGLSILGVSAPERMAREEREEP